MTSGIHAVPPAGLAESRRSTVTAIADFFRQAAAIISVETHKLFRDPTELVTRGVQPALWLLVFGQVFTRTHAIPTGDLTYLEFMAPGVLAQSVLFTSIFYGISIIWERDLGIVHKLLISPASRIALVLGKAVAGGLRALSQAVIIIILALILGVNIRLNPLSLIGVALVVVLGGALFSTFSLVVACLVKTRERFMGIGQVLTMPLFFASNAIYPLSIMPQWLIVVARVNPLTYLVDALRVLMVHQGESTAGIPMDFAVLIVAMAGFVLLAAWLFPRIVR